MTAQAPMPAERRRRMPALPAKARAEFLEAIACGWSVTHAAARAAVHRNRFYERAEVDETFAEAWRQADESGLHVLEDEIRRRAVDGWEEPIYQKGELVGQVRRYSDNLLMFLTKKKDPSYRDNARLEVTGANGGAIELDAGYRPTTLRDVLALARDLGLAGDLVDGDAVEDAELLELGEGEAS